MTLRRETGPRVTAHAISRYRERVEMVSYDEVLRRLKTKAIARAIEIGACSVKLPTGHRAIIEGNAIVTIHPKPFRKRRHTREIEE